MKKICSILLTACLIISYTTNAHGLCEKADNYIKIHKALLSTPSTNALMSGIGNFSPAFNSHTVAPMMVTRPDGSTTGAVNRLITSLPISTNALLAGLSASSTTLSAGFDAHIVGYTVDAGLPTVTITPVASNAFATIKINDIVVASGQPSAPVALSPGLNRVTIVVTAQDGTTTKTYVVNFIRPGSADATLANLTLSSGTLSPGFTPGTTSYTANINQATSNITITPLANYHLSTVKVNGATIPIGSASAPISLAVGANIINIVVTAEDGTITKTYTVNVIRPPSSNANLDNLVLSSGTFTHTFASATTGYAANVANATSVITVTPVSSEANSTIKVNGTTVISGSASTLVALAVGNNIISVTIIAQNGTTTKTYTVNVIRAGSSNADLANLVVSPGTLAPVFSSGTIAYTASVAIATTSVTIMPVSSDSNSAIKVNGNTVTSGSASTPIALTVGANSVNIVITAQDGITQKTYTVNVTSPGAQVPAITSFSPATGPIGTLVTITGRNLAGPAAFAIGGVPAIVVSNTGNTLVGMVMPGAVTGPLSITTQGGTVSVSGASNFTVTPGIVPHFQQGGLIATTDKTSTADPAIAVSADGNTVVLGMASDNFDIGATRIFTRNGNAWTQQGPKLIGTGAIGTARQGWAVAISADGNTVIIGGYLDNGSAGAAWVFTRTGGVWVQQGGKLVGSGFDYPTSQGSAVDLSADGNTAVIGGPNNAGGVWVFTRSGGTWTQQGNKLVGTGGVGGYAYSTIGVTLAVSADGGTIVTGVPGDAYNIGAAWIFTRSGSTWSQQGSKLVGSNYVGQPHQGSSVAISADGNTVLTGGLFDNSHLGATWVFNRTGNVWAQQGNKLVGTGAINNDEVLQGNYVSLSADGNTAFVSGPGDNKGADGISPGALWTFTRSGSIWTQQGAKLVPANNPGGHMVSVALSADGSTAVASSLLATTALGPERYLAGFVAYAANGSNEAHLAGLKVSNGSLSPAFSATGLSYRDTVSHATASVTITPTAIDPGATIKVNGAAVASGATSASISLATGTNTITTVVTAPDGKTTQAYTIKVTQLSNFADLSNLTISNGMLSPAFAAKTISYKDTVDFATTSLQVTPTCGTVASVKVNGVLVTSGAASASLPLSVGTTTITTVVTAQDATTKTYTVKVTRISNFAGLSALAVSEGALSPAFSPNTLNYVNTVGSGISAIKVTPTCGTVATVKVNGLSVVSGYPSAIIPLSPGENIISVVVTAQDGTTKKTYTVKVTRQAGPVAATLAASAVTTIIATLNGLVNDNGSATTVSFTYGTSPTLGGVTKTLAATTGGAVNAGTGNVAAAVNITGLVSKMKYYYRVVATNSSGTTNGAILSFTTLASANAILTDLTINAGTLSPVFAQQTTNYTLTVPGSIRWFSVTPTTSNAFSTVTVGGSVVHSGQASQVTYLEEGVNIINTIVTAQDGATTKTYKMLVTRGPAVPIATTLPDSPAYENSAILQGRVDPNGHATTVSFVYGTSPTLSGAKTVAATFGGTIDAGSSDSYTFASVSGLLSGTLYYYKVSAVNSAGTGDGDILSFTTRASSNAFLSGLSTNNGTLSPAFTQSTTSYMVSVPNTTSVITVKPLTSDAFATVTVNGVAVTSGQSSPAVMLNVGSNLITTIVTAQDGKKIRTYKITVTRALAGLNATYFGVIQPTETMAVVPDDGVVVHQALSPNGDGINDVFRIDGIAAYPDNRVTIINNNGVAIFEARGYDNASKVFNGHSNKTGAMQQAGTYFYTLDYQAGSEIKHKTGYIILKY